MKKIGKFFSNLYHKFIHLSWVEWTVDYCKEKPVMAAIVGGIFLLIVGTLIAIVCVGKKAKKEKQQREIEEAAQKAAKALEEQFNTHGIPANAIRARPVPTDGADASAFAQGIPFGAQPVTKIDVVPVATPTATEKAEETAVAAEVETPTQAVEITATVEEVETPAPVEEPVNETVEEPVEEKQTTAQEVNETIAMVESLDEDSVLPDHDDEGETDRIARYKGKWVICRVLTDEEESEETYFFELRAYNGEKLLSSEEYTTYQGALRGIQTHRTNILKGNLKVTLSKKGDYIFKLLSGKNMLLCMGENYPTKARCESAIDSTIRFAATAIIDENVQDILIKVPKEEDTPLPPLPENYSGKWIISSGLNAEGAKIYYFELFANNGEKLLSSEEYTTYIGAINGIQTHKKNVEKDNFRISLTKRGDYIYKLLNGNGQLLCLGEHYKTKRLCQNAVESVKRFAASSTVLTDADKK